MNPPEPAAAREGWYVRSLASGDVHRGMLDDGSVRAACGTTFYPLLAQSGPPACSTLPAPEQVCPGCMMPKAPMVIPATCSTHPTTDVVVGVVVRGVGNGRVELRSHPDTGCALTVPAALLVDVLGLWMT